MTSGPTDQQMRLGRLLELRDFRALLIEWLDSGITPWAGPVAPEQSADASYVNGRASFVSLLVEEVHQYFPAQYNTLQQERLNVRTQLDE